MEKVSRGPPRPAAISGDQPQLQPRVSQPHLRRRPTQLALETCSPRSVWNSVLAGYAAGVSGTLVGHPFDSVKVWMQTRGSVSKRGGVIGVGRAASTSAGGGGAGTSSLSSSSNPAGRPFIGRVDAAATAAQARSWSLPFQRIRTLYTGVVGPLLSVGLIQSVNFAIYDSSRRMLYGWDHPDASDLEYLHHDSLFGVGAASGFAGLVLCFVTSPLVIIKVKQQSLGLTFAQALRDTVVPGTGGGAAGGRIQLRTMYVGFPLHMLSESMGRVVYYATYESLKRNLVQRSETDATASPSCVVARQPISLPERMGCAAAAGIACWSAIFPIDAIRSRLFARPGSEVLVDHGSALASAARVARHMYATQGGLRAFFRGYAVTVLRAGPVAAAVLPVYDLALERLSGL